MYTPFTLDMGLPTFLNGFDETLTQTIRVWHSVDGWARECASNGNVVPQGFRVEAFGGSGRVGIHRKGTIGDNWEWKAFIIPIPRMPTEPLWEVVSPPRLVF
jgi:hypothetical protein